MWLLIAIVSYFFFAVVALVDKYILSGPLSSPKTYVFYVSMLGGGVVAVVALFGYVTIPTLSIAIFGLTAGVMRAFALLLLFGGLRSFEASRIIPAFGGALPIFIFFLTVLFTADKQILMPVNFAAFGLLLVGTVGISLTGNLTLTIKSLSYAGGAALFAAGSFFLSKFVYDAEPFLSGLSWLLLGAFLISFLFLLSPEVRHEVSRVFIRQKKVKASKRFPVWLFLGTQIAGGSAALLQNLSVALVPFGLLPLVSAMGGVEYLFLFIFAFILSRRFPSMFHEEISRAIILQKIASIIFISSGLLLLAL